MSTNGRHPPLYGLYPEQPGPYTPDRKTRGNLFESCYSLENMGAMLLPNWQTYNLLPETLELLQDILSVMGTYRSLDFAMTIQHGHFQRLY